jgi:hypothetical protein
VFLQLYQQGYPIDQLLRIMIERIETPTLQSGEQLVLVNSPTGTVGTNQLVVAQESGEMDGWGRRPLGAIEG